MDREDIVRQLESQSTWRLFFLCLITFGLYQVHYIKWQTQKLNQYQDEKLQISNTLLNLIIILTYLGAVLMISNILVEEGNPIGDLCELVNQLAFSITLIWAFEVRSRMHMLFGATKENVNWFHGFWTFIFTALYFNYKINQMNDFIDSNKTRLAEAQN